MTTRGKKHLDEMMPQLGQICSQGFRRVAHYCRKQFQVPVAAIGMREGRHVRLYFSQDGQQRLLVDDALCGLPLVIPGEQIFIRDLELVPEEMQPHLALALGVRSYVGVPIFLRQQLVGSLNLADHQPRDFSSKEIARLKELAKWTGNLMELHL
ncbi:GAF domain-containing protein [Marinospirillum celere]|uniref:GAF domain-containing protein n=1 Tax=Marinospirillum celere TaxID=1122252 RepID=A0A1I1FP97_9GAMM|nr:GAF domain-containing protein [Marinospirillum celere]SFC00836.1 GAF domain-containing protein [Marinospirillum celere]